MPIRTQSIAKHYDVPHISVFNTMQRIMDSEVPERMGLTRLQVCRCWWGCPQAPGAHVAAGVHVLVHMWVGLCAFALWF